MTSFRQKAWQRTAVFSALLFLTASCSGGPGSPFGKDEPLQTKPVAEVAAQAEDRAQAAATAAGASLENWRVGAAPCLGHSGEITDNGSWDLAGFATIWVDAEEQLSILDRIRDMRRKQGYEITEDHVFDDDTGGSVSMRDSDTGITMSLTTNKNRDGLALILASACYLPVEGEDPANDGEVWPPFQPSAAPDSVRGSDGDA